MEAAKAEYVGTEDCHLGRPNLKMVLSDLISQASTSVRVIASGLGLTFVDTVNSLVKTICFLCQVLVYPEDWSELARLPGASAGPVGLVIGARTACAQAEEAMTKSGQMLPPVAFESHSFIF